MADLRADLSRMHVVVVSYNTEHLTIQCVASLLENCIPASNITVVDNCSDDNTVASLQKTYSAVSVIAMDMNRGYSAAVNAGMEQCDKPFAMIINADVYFPLGSIISLMENLIALPEYAVLGFQQRYPNGKKQKSWGDFPGIGDLLQRIFFFDFIKSLYYNNNWKSPILNSSEVNIIKNVDYVDGAIMMVRSELFRFVNGFDEEYFFFSEEADFCWRIAKQTNYKIGINLNISAYHYRGSSRDANEREFSDFTCRNNAYSLYLFCKKNLHASYIVYYKLGMVYRYAFSAILYGCTSYFSATAKIKLRNSLRLLKHYAITRI